MFASKESENGASLVNERSHRMSIAAAYERLRQELTHSPRRWLVTGVAGFIGSHLLQHLLELGQTVVGLDDLSTGYQHNLDDVQKTVDENAWKRFSFVQGSITNLETCQQACQGAEIVLHQAALGSVPRSIKNPLASHDANINGFLNMIVAAKETGAARLVFASSSSVYGDHPALPKVEAQTGKLLSPYALTKYTNELYSAVFARCYAMQTVGLRYFNVFGRRQDPEGAYAAVIPCWFRSFLKGESCSIFGDGETSRDFTHVTNVVQANLLAATAPTEVSGEAFNVACGERLTLRQLHDSIAAVLIKRGTLASIPEPTWKPFRPGDIRHSLADISKARSILGYEPSCTLAQGLEEAADWYVEHCGGVTAKTRAA